MKKPLLTAITFEKSAKQVLKKLNQRNTLLITDAQVWFHYQHLWKGWKAVVLPAGEKNKNLNSLSIILQACMDQHLDKQGTIIGFGGGTITDITGLAAAVYLRGIRCVQVPTSFLAMVDAALGGKNGINWGGYKNQVGTISQPAEVMICSEWLSTLPQEEWTSAMAEVIKYGAIADVSLFKKIQLFDAVSIQQTKELVPIIQTCVAIKMKIVARDEKENNVRKWLNFGHTIGHAIESSYALLHGQAVSIGMMVAATLSETYIGFKGKENLRQLLQQYGLPTSGSFETATILHHVMQDKKRKHKHLDFVLLKKLGKAEIQPIPIRSLEKEIKAMNFLHEDPV